MKYTILFACLLFLTGSPCLAQQADEELAAQFMTNQEYAKASDMYEKLLSRNPRSMYFYDNLLKCYISMPDFAAAQKLVKKQSRRFEESWFYRVDQGYLLRLQKDDKKAEEHFLQLVNQVRPIHTDVFELAKAFEKRNEKPFAIETYLKGRKLLNYDLAFAGELAGLYSDLNDKPHLVDEYLNVLVADESLMQEVQGFLQNSLSSASDFEVLKLALQKRNKQFPDRSTFNEMLVWLHVQRIEYELALVYARSLDRKYREEGRRLVELGFMAEANAKYDAAIHIYQQVQLMGRDKPYYAMARNNETDCRAKKILSGKYTQAELLVLAAEYRVLLNEFGKNPSTANTLRSLANLEAFYLNQYDSAIGHYEEIIQMPRVDRNLLANCKLELGDYYVMRGEVWEAMLLYGQVDKDFLQEPLGQEAKFRNARLSYYLGEFEWAKAQLDILKTATTQLISNNALELSLLIQDNTVDSVYEPLQYFARADLNYVQGNNEVALRQLDSISILFPKHSLTDDILYKKAEIYQRAHDYKRAAEFYKIVFSEHGSDILGDNALFRLAQLYQFQLNDPNEAKNLYEKFIDTYPGSFFLTECRKQFRLLRGDQLN